MRPVAAAAAALGLGALALAPLGPVQAAEGDATAHLLTAEELNAAALRDDAPVILRGSAIEPRPLAARFSGPSWQIAGGRRLWMVDPVTGDLRTCSVPDTTDVGVWEIRCLSGSTSRYRRTFGPAFSP